MTPATLRRITVPQSPALLPQMRFAGMPDGLGLDAFRSGHAAVIGAGVPYWAVAWPAGQALARWMLDHPDRIAGRPVVDVGCGAGLIAAAAMLAGACEAVATDTDPNALLAAQETARLNDVAVTILRGGLDAIETAPLPPDALICAADLWYEPQLARLATAALTRLAARGAEVLCADPGRPGRPRRGALQIARYIIRDTGEFGTGGDTVLRILRLVRPDILGAHCPPADESRDAETALR